MIKQTDLFNKIRRIFNRLTSGYRLSTNRFWFPRSKTAGEMVTEDTALTYSAVWRAVSLISETVACIPWVVNVKKDVDGRKIREPLYTHPAYRLLSLQPNPETDALAFKQMICASALTWGNGFAEIERDRSGTPRALWQIEPHRVSIERDVNNKIVYKIDNGAKEATYLEQKDMFHVKGMSYDGISGYSVISYAARSIGGGIAVDQFGADFFANGAQESGVLTHPGQLGEAGQANLRDSIKHATGKGHHHEPLILEEGMTWTHRTIPPDDAQFLETKRFNVTDVARWFGVPVHKLMEMGQAKFNNVEHQNIEFMTDSIMAWVRRFEIEADIKLISRAQAGRVYTNMNMNSRLRGDSGSRAEYYQTMWNIGAYSVNKILELEDENPIGDEGDKHLVQLNLTTLEKVGDETNDAIGAEVGTAAKAASNDEDDDALEALRNQARTILAEAFGRIVSRQERRLKAASKKYDHAPQRAFYEYLDKFIDDNEKYMAKTLSAGFSVYCPGVDVTTYCASWCRNLKLEISDNYKNSRDELSLSVDINEIITELLRG